MFRSEVDVFIKLYSIDCGPIAQSVEQMAFNHWVEGSSPSRITIIFNKLGHLLQMPFSCLCA